MKLCAKGRVPLHERRRVRGVIVKKDISCKKVISSGLDAYAKQGGLSLWVFKAVKNLFG